MQVPGAEASSFSIEFLCKELKELTRPRGPAKEFYCYHLPTKKRVVLLCFVYHLIFVVEAC